MHQAIIFGTPKTSFKLELSLTYVLATGFEGFYGPVISENRKGGY